MNNDFKQGAASKSSLAAYNSNTPVIAKLENSSTKDLLDPHARRKRQLGKMSK